MADHFDVQVAECLESLDRGEDLASVLARYPGQAAELEPILSLTLGLPELAAAPRVGAQATSRQSFLAQAAELKAARTARWPAVLRAWLAPPRRMALAGGALAVLVGLGLALVAVERSVPGDGLYGTKRALEATVLHMMPTEELGSQLLSALAARRRAEVRQLLASGRPATVEVEGVIEEVRPNAWVVSGLVAELGPGTQVLGTPETGEAARLVGHTEAGHLLVDAIVCEPPAGEAWPVLPGTAPAPSP